LSVLLIAIGFVTMAHATVIGFDNIAAGTNVNGMNLGGVTITAPDSVVNIYNGGDVGYISPYNTVVASSWTQGLTLNLTFDNAVNFVSVYGGDEGYDTDRFSMQAYDLYGNPIAFADTGDFNGPDPLYPVVGASMGDYRLLSLSGSGIKSVVLTQVDWGCGWDNLTFNSTSVPEPTTMLLLGLGLIGVAGIRRKLK